MTKNAASIVSWINVVLALINIPIGIYQWVATWYLNLIVAGTNLVLVINRKDYGQIIMRIFTLLLSCYGLYKWSCRGRKQTEKRLQITKTAPKTWFFLVCSALIFWGMLSLCLYGIQIRFPADQTAEQPINNVLSAFLTTMSLVGQWLTANKKLESNLYWSGLNLVFFYYHYVYYSSPLYLKYIVYLPWCLYGYYVWRKQYSSNHKAG